MTSTPSHRPLFLPIGLDEEVACPRQGRIDAARCAFCELFQGTLEGPDRQVVCGINGAGLHVRPLSVTTEVVMRANALDGLLATAALLGLVVAACAWLPLILSN